MVELFSLDWLVPEKIILKYVEWKLLKKPWTENEINNWLASLSSLRINFNNLNILKLELFHRSLALYLSLSISLSLILSHFLSLFPSPSCLYLSSNYFEKCSYNNVHDDYTVLSTLLGNAVLLTMAVETIPGIYLPWL